VATRVYDEDVSEMIELADKGLTVREIGRQLNRHPRTIARHLERFKPTGAMARRYYESKQYELAQRVVERATVEQILEIQDRLDVLPKKLKDSGGSQVMVCIGMPGQPAMPVPPRPPPIALLDRSSRDHMPIADPLEKEIAPAHRKE